MPCEMETSPLENRLTRSIPFTRWLLLLLVPLVAACSVNDGVPGSSEVVDLPIEGTIFTIVFENHSQDAVLKSKNRYLMELASRYGTADAYLGELHPSLPNYLVMTSGRTHGVDDNDPPAKHPLGGTDNLAAQLDAADVPWRAYMEDMGEPCVMNDVGKYAVRHNPFVYYTALSGDKARCDEHVVDMETHFADDLASNAYRYMWITPNECNDMHDCSTETADEWLSRIIPQIMESPGYKNGGAIFLLWDEGNADVSYVTWYLFKNPQNIPFVLISENLVSPGFVSNTRYGHDSYLATVQDALGLPRLPSTVDSTPMADFFGLAPALGEGTATPDETVAPDEETAAPDEETVAPDDEAVAPDDEGYDDTGDPDVSDLP